MILILKPGVTKEQTMELCEWVARFGVDANPIFGSGTTIVGLVGDTSAIDIHKFDNDWRIEKVMKVQEPFKRANRKFHPDNSIIPIGSGITVGGRKIAIAAGPCSIESEEQVMMIAESVKASGAVLLRGGAFKPRTSPYAFQGLKAEGLLYMRKAADALGIPVVSEITNPSQMELFDEYVDVIQVGTRNMQNFELLKEVGRSRKPVLLKRGFANTLEELLMSAEYIMSSGNQNVILCERGIRTFETATRNTLDISAIPVLKKMTHLPVFVDPSHAGGMAWLVEPLSMAAIAAGADGLIIEVHNDPKNALSDGQQSLTPEDFRTLVGKLSSLAALMGREI
ncbi:MAG: 3-deoxy-7-phosphoheptulonate synthase [Saccharofermentanales bacterium]